MLGTGGQVLRHANGMGGIKIARVLGLFLARQPRDRVLDFGSGGQKQGDGADQPEATVHALENRARQKGAVCESIGVYHVS